METSQPISNENKTTSRKGAIKVIESLVTIVSGIIATLQFFGGLTIDALFLVCRGVSILVTVLAGGLIGARKTGVAERVAWIKKLADQVSDKFLWILVGFSFLTFAWSFIDIREIVTQVGGGIPKPRAAPATQEEPKPVGIVGEKREPTPRKLPDDSGSAGSNQGPTQTLMDVLSVRAKSPRNDESGLTEQLIAALSPRLKIPGYENVKNKSIVVEISFDENVDGRLGGQIWGKWNIEIQGLETCRYEKRGKYGGGGFATLDTAKEEAVNNGLEVVVSYLRENVSVTGLHCVK